MAVFNLNRKRTVYAIYSFHKNLLFGQEEVLYILFKFRTLKKSVWLICVCEFKVISRIHMGTHLSDTYPVHSRLKKECFVPTAFNFATERCYTTGMMWHTGVPQQFSRHATNFYKKLNIRML